MCVSRIDLNRSLRRSSGAPRVRPGSPCTLAARGFETQSVVATRRFQRDGVTVRVVFVRLHVEPRRRTWPASSASVVPMRAPAKVPSFDGALQFQAHDLAIDDHEVESRSTAIAQVPAFAGGFLALEPGEVRERASPAPRSCRRGWGRAHSFRDTSSRLQTTRRPAPARRPPPISWCASRAPAHGVDLA